MVPQPATARKLKSCAPGLPSARGVPWSESGNCSGECKGEVLARGECQGESPLVSGRVKWQGEWLHWLVGTCRGDSDQPFTRNADLE
jgi:hypothetical protein